MGDLIDMASASAALLEKRRCEKWRVAYGPEIAKRRPDIAYVCKDLAIAPGVSIFGGGGFSGKTTSLQALMLAIATGSLAWEHFDVTRGDVAHVDFEQGPDLTFLKYQRMARHMKIDLDGIGRSLACSSLPRASLDDSQESADELRWLLEGRKAAIVDAFRGAFPGAQENDSGARKYLDMVHAVGIEIGCAIIVVAHSRKLSDDSDDARSSLRGSSALFDAPQTVWMLSGKKGKPTKCENVKERMRGKIRESFGLTIEDVCGPGANAGEIDDEWGLSVRYLSGPEVQAEYIPSPNDGNTVADNVARLETYGARITDLLRRAPDGLSPHTLRSLIGGSALDINAVMPMLIQSCAVTIEGTGPMKAYHYVPPREPGED